VLAVLLRNLTYRYPNHSFILGPIDLSFDPSTHTAIAGPARAGASTLLRLIAGTLRPQSGEIRLGARVVNDLKPSARPLLFVTSAIDAPGRWSVQHLLIAAARTRSLDRIDRQREIELATSKWKLDAVVDRRLDSLSSTEKTLANLARIELLRPAIVVADRLLELLNATMVDEIADEFFRTLRVIGATVINAPATRAELGATDRVVVLDRGRVAQSGVVSQLFHQPESEASAIATGHVNAIPIEVRGNRVESSIGAWEVGAPPFQGSGLALIRPSDFAVAAAGEESDLIFGVEEASFSGGAWHARGFLTGGVVLRVTLPATASVHKGKLLALRYDPAVIRLVRS
jgi:ABC-type sugar transport system ATPase subunit